MYYYELGENNQLRVLATFSYATLIKTFFNEVITVLFLVITFYSRGV